jgi:hypothetical protein
VEFWPEKTAVPPSAACRPSPAMKKIRERRSGLERERSVINEWKMTDWVYIPLCLLTFSLFC